MKGGMVVKIRLSPSDCLSVLDAMDRVGIDPYGRSFAGCVSLVVASLLETSRRAGILPEPDTFQFMNRMSFWRGGQSTAERRKATEGLYMDRMNGLSPPVLRDSGLQERTKAGISPASIPVSLDPSLKEKYEEEYQALVSIVKEGAEVTAEVLERFSYLQGLLF